MNGLIVGVDAANIRRGGGVTHLVELLRTAKPEQHGISNIVIWAGRETLAVLDNQLWLVKRNPDELNGGLLSRTLWQKLKLATAARAEKCDLLFIPGGSYSGSFSPVVSMSQNLLPFEMKELLRYGWTLFTLKLLLLRITQGRSFRRSQGVIFLTDYAQQAVQKVTGALAAQQTIIPHGFHPRFAKEPKQQHEISSYDVDDPYRILYVSIIDQYKHQWSVVEAVAMLRKRGLPVVLELVGPAYSPAMQRLNEAIERWDIDQEWVKYLGAIPFDELHHRYAEANLGLFASSCENLPNILIETMAAGLPIVCSNRGPMPEVLGDAGLYFDPEQPQQIEKVLLKLIRSPGLRTQLAEKSANRVKRYSWDRCADETFSFLSRVALKSKR